VYRSINKRTNKKMAMPKKLIPRIGLKILWCKNKIIHQVGFYIWISGNKGNFKYFDRLNTGFEFKILDFFYMIKSNLNQYGN
jgi:hypothetical protein